jgi:hypothetical protein
MARRGLGIEDKIHKDFAAIIRQLELYKKLNCNFWSYDSTGEKRTVMTASLLKAKGLQSGKADYLFIKNRQCGRKHGCNSPIFETLYFWIEFKKPKTKSAAGKQSESQKDFEDIFKDSVNSFYFVAYSVKEAIEFLEKNGVIKK